MILDGNKVRFLWKRGKVMENIRRWFENDQVNNGQNYEIDEYEGHLEARTGTVGEITQEVRKTDLDVNTANQNAVNKYDKTGLGIEVTYKITITNESQTI